MRKHYAGWSAILFVVFMLCLSGICFADEATPKTPDQPAAAKETKPPKNAAIVNGTPISYKDFSQEVDIYKQRMMEKGSAIPEQYLSNVRTQMVQEMINGELLLQASKKEGIKIKKEEIQKELDAIKAQPERYQTIIATMKLNDEQLKEKLGTNLAVKQLLEQKVFTGINIEQKDTKAFYDGHPDYFQMPEQVRARHILKKVEKDSTDKQKAEARKALEGIKARILAGEDFAELAKEQSEGPSKDAGGDLGYFAKGKMVKPFAEAAFALKPNEVSDIVETQFGFHIIKVLDHRDAKTIPFEEAKKRIEESLKKQQMKEKLTTYLGELRKKAKIETFVK
jgi:peptidyl-prolyl cis-trans isomerase C